MFYYLKQFLSYHQHSIVYAQGNEIARENIVGLYITMSAENVRCGLYSQAGTQRDYYYGIHLLVLCITNVTVAMAGISLNGFVLYIFLKSSLLRSKTGFFLVAVLSAFDLLVVIVVHPLAVVYLYSEIIQSNVVCKYEMFYNMLRYLMCSLSSYVLLVMSTERLIGVCFPFYYQRSVTKSKISWCVALTCLIIIGEWLLTIKVKSTRIIMVIAQLSFLFLAAGIIYTVIYITARKKRAQNSIFQSRELREQRQHLLKNIKLNSLYVLVTLTFIVFLCPTLVTYILEYYSKPADSHYPIFLIIRLWARTFVTMNSTFNCCVYFWKNSILRKEAKKIMRTSR